MVEGSLSMTPVTKSTPHTTQSHHPITTGELKERHLLWALSGGYGGSTTCPIQSRDYLLAMR